MTRKPEKNGPRGPFFFRFERFPFRPGGLRRRFPENVGIFVSYSAPPVRGIKTSPSPVAYRERIRNTLKNRRISRAVTETITPPLRTISKTGSPM